MTKKVDLQQLLNKKFDKPDELTYQTLMEEVDKVLEQFSNIMAWSKITDPGNIEEYYVNSWTDSSSRNGRPSERGYKENANNMPEVVPDKLAEDVPSLSPDATKTGKTRGATYEYKVVVPDMMQLLFSKENVPLKGEDKKILDGIISSIPGYDWKSRISYMNRVLNDQLQEHEKNFNFQTMISSLITLNCLKKIAFDVGNLSKGGIFEYFMAKLSGSKFQVIPASSKTVIDIEADFGNFKSGSSLKLLGNYKNVSIRGSRNRLGETRVNYIIAQVFKDDKSDGNKVIFYEVNIRGVVNLPQDTSYIIKNNEIHVNLNYTNDTQFRLDLVSVVDKLGKKENPDAIIDFKNLKSYNYRLNQLVRMYQNTVYTILTNLTQLNDNLTKYLSVEQSKVSAENAAGGAVNNAKNIVTGVNSMVDKSG